MASVTSLDKDLRDLRLEKYTPQRAKETLGWIESILGERLSSPDLLEALKDGTVLCRLANLVLDGNGNGVRYKSSSMPFVQMENISHFLRACQSPPINLAAHDCFLTVDLFEQKDPAQVLQCIGAFSRKAATLQPGRFPTDIAGKKATALSPQSSGVGSSFKPGSPATNPGLSKGASASPTGSSTWAKKKDIGNVAPAWNIAQYGWTGGANQGNQGVSFGAPRQIVSEQPYVPSLAEKEKRRREQEAETERQRRLAAEEAQRRQAQIEEEERVAKQEEARRWEEETRRQKELERQEVEAEKRRWQEEERKWKEEDEQRKREEKEAEAKAETERNSRPVLHGQYLSQYRADKQQSTVAQAAPTSESERIKELERQLEEAREREKRYENGRMKLETQKSGSVGASADANADTDTKTAASVPAQPRAPVEDEWDDRDTERTFLRQQWKKTQDTPAQPPRPLPVPGVLSSTSVPSRPLPVPGQSASQSTDSNPVTKEDKYEEPPASPRPLPNPSGHVAPLNPASRTDRFLSTNPAPRPAQPMTHTPAEAAFSSSAEQNVEDSRRQASQAKTRAGGWASKSLLEREMERERERQREWEEDQKATKAAVDRGDVDPNAGVGPGQSWDVNSYGYTGGDNLNKSGAGVYSGRRQIIGGPRPMN